jgi:hypothetical protein
MICPTCGYPRKEMMTAEERVDMLMPLAAHEAAHAVLASALGLPGEYSVRVSEDGSWFHRGPRSDMVAKYLPKLASTRAWSEGHY